jgi:hypothetical protein
MSEETEKVYQKLEEVINTCIIIDYNPPYEKLKKVTELLS